MRSAYVTGLLLLLQSTNVLNVRTHKRRRPCVVDKAHTAQMQCLRNDGRLLFLASELQGVLL